MDIKSDVNYLTKVLHLIQVLFSEFQMQLLHGWSKVNFIAWQKRSEIPAAWKWKLNLLITSNKFYGPVNQCWYVFSTIRFTWRFYVNSNNFWNSKYNCFYGWSKDNFQYCVIQMSEAPLVWKWKLTLSTSWSFPKFGEWYGSINIILKCRYVFKLWLNLRFYMNSNRKKNSLHEQLLQSPSIQ